MHVIVARIRSVVDGDTVKVRAFSARRRYYTVRLIGIDTPETRKPGTPVECGGPEATANLKRLALTSSGTGERVRLTTDPTQDTFDRYGRLLAYVRVTGGPQLNLSQVRAGWAKVYVFRRNPFRQIRAFRRVQRSAHAASRGVWGQCSGDFHAAEPGAHASRACAGFDHGGRVFRLRAYITSCTAARSIARRWVDKFSCYPRTPGVPRVCRVARYRCVSRRGSSSETRRVRCTRGERLVTFRHGY